MLYSTLLYVPENPWVKYSVHRDLIFQINARHLVPTWRRVVVLVLVVHGKLLLQAQPGFMAHGENRCDLLVDENSSSRLIRKEMKIPAFCDGKVSIRLCKLKSETLRVRTTNQRAGSFHRSASTSNYSMYRLHQPKIKVGKKKNRNPLVKKNRIFTNGIPEFAGK